MYFKIVNCALGHVFLLGLMLSVLLLQISSYIDTGFFCDGLSFVLLNGPATTLEAMDLPFYITSAQPTTIFVSILTKLTCNRYKMFC